MDDKAKQKLLRKVQKAPEQPLKTKSEKVPEAEKPVGGIPIVDARLRAASPVATQPVDEPTDRRQPISVRYQGVKVNCEFTENGWYVEFDTPERDDAYITPTLLRQLERRIRYEFKLYMRGISTKRRLDAAKPQPSAEKLTVKEAISA